jgi:cysteine-rich repeat protein
MARGALHLMVVGVLVFSSGCWGRSVWADFDGGANMNNALRCGNDRLEGGEECDGSNLAGYSCENLGLVGGELACSSTCAFDVSGCGGGGDCGNGTLDDGEECDGSNLDGMDCWGLDYAGGTLSCTSACRFETNMCTTFEGCGNYIPEFGEECDDGNTAPCDGCDGACRLEFCGNGVVDCNEECDDGNALPGDGCSPSCQAEWECGDGVCDASAGESCANCPSDCCNQCGNGLMEPGMGEQCDGADLGGDGCQDHCYADGVLGCSYNCTFDFSGCFGGPPCGDGVAECDEECDGADLQGQTCQSFNFSEGTLGCTAGCGFDTSACSGQLHYLYETFEGATLSDWTLTGDWEWGVPTGFSSEPSSAYEGQQVLGTRMGQDYRDNQQYMSNLAQSPLINLVNATTPVLVFWGWITAEQCCDGANVWVRPQGSSLWTHLGNPSVPYTNSISGYSAWTGPGLASWTEVEFDLSAYVGQSIQIAFSMHTDGSVTEPGAYVDQVLVTEAGEVPVSITTFEDLGVTMAVAPFSAQLSAMGGFGPFLWTLEPGGLNDWWLSLNGTTGLLSGTPADTNAGPVEVLVRAASQGNPGNYDERRFYLEVQREIWGDTLDVGAIGWTLAGDWEWGTPTTVGPSACQSGSCIGLRMSSNYNNNLQWSLCTATSPPIDLTGTISPTLRFWSYVDTEGSNWDGGNLKITTGGPAFTLVTGVDPPYNLSSVDGQAAWGGDDMTNGWQQFEADLSPFAGQTIRLQFGFRSDGSVRRPGWYVDELAILDY